MDDPLLYGFEAFLAAHHPEIQRARGVYYTPPPLIQYLVSSVDQILRRDFGLADGLGDRVEILDPAAGTGAFLCGVIDHVFSSFKGQSKDWPGYVRAHLLPRISGYELLLAPCAIAQLLIRRQLKATGCDLSQDEAIHLYWKDALSGEGPMPAHETDGTSPLLILGNPPYRGQAGTGEPFIRELLRSYFLVDGEPLGERNPKWLNDDYVKFMRLSEWLIKQRGAGILAFVTNHGYLDNPTFRGMRRSLMQSFDEIYLLDLHGNKKKHERAPDGSEDHNVFAIQQGVALGIFVKRGRAQGGTGIMHSERFGTRAEKYDWLRRNDVTTTRWQRLSPAPAPYLFVPRDERLLEEYQQGFRIPDILPQGSVGIATARDRLTIHFSEEEAWNTVVELARLEEASAREIFALGQDAEDWKVTWAQDDVRSSGPHRRHLQRVLYRPFDVRWTYYTGRSRGFHCRPRAQVMQHMMLGENLGLVTSRLTKGEPFSHVQVSRLPVEVICLSPKTSNNGFLFPLYLYGPSGTRRANLGAAFGAAITERLRLRLVHDGTADLLSCCGPEDVFRYVYAVLSSPSYRRRYRGLLAADFPRVPLTSSPSLFRALCSIGAELVCTQLLEAQLREPATLPEQQAAPELWSFCIGGYQPLKKWLRSHRHRRLTIEEEAFPRRIAAAIMEMQRLMERVDAAIEEHGGWPIC